MPNYTIPTSAEWRGLRTDIGAIVVSGAQIEGVLSIMIQIVWPIVGPNSAAKEIPWKLSQRIYYLKRALNGRFKDYYLEAGPLLTRVKAFKDVRDPIVHGYIAGFNRRAQTITFLRHEMRGTIRTDKYNRFAISTLTRTGKEGRSLGLALAHFLMKFSDILPEG